MSSNQIGECDEMLSIKRASNTTTTTDDDDDDDDGPHMPAQSHRPQCQKENNILFVVLESVSEFPINGTENSKADRSTDPPLAEAELK